MRVRTSRVPIGYRELEYIESTGTQYIDSGVSYNANNVYVCKFIVLNLQYPQSNYSGIMGQDGKIQIAYERNGSWQTGAGSGGSVNINTMYIGKVDCATQKLYINDVHVATRSSQRDTSTKIGILGYDSYRSYARVYSASISNSGTLVRNFIPCERISDNKPGLYDTVNNVFYTNSGTGEFVKGPYKDSYNCPILIEEGTTNLDPYKTTAPNFPYATLKEKVYFKGKWCWHIKVESNKTGWIGSYLSLGGYPENTVMTRSCLLYIPSGQPNTNGWYGLPFAFEGMNAITRKKVYDLSKKDTWQYCYCTGTAKNTSSNYLIYMIAANSGPVAIEFYITDIQFEQKDHPTPYTPDTRAANYVQCSSPKINLLPMEYQGVEYIQSSGTQYIDTGYAADETSCINFKFQYTSISTNYNRVFGSRKNVNALLNMRSSTSNGGKFYMEWARSAISNPNIDTNAHEVLLDSPNKIYKFDNTVYSSSFEVPSNVNTYNMYIFATNDGGTDGSKRFYYYKHSKSGNLIQYLIPCYRKSDSVIGMYDTVNKQFYTNSGTGTFIKGPDKNYII